MSTDCSVTYGERLRMRAYGSVRDQSNDGANISVRESDGDRYANLVGE